MRAHPLLRLSSRVFLHASEQPLFLVWDALFSTLGTPFHKRWKEVCWLSNDNLYSPSSLGTDLQATDTINSKLH